MKSKYLGIVIAAVFAIGLVSYFSWSGNSTLEDSSLDDSTLDASTLERPSYEEPDFQEPDFEESDFKAPEFEEPTFEEPVLKYSTFDNTKLQFPFSFNDPEVFEMTKPDDVFRTFVHEDDLFDVGGNLVPRHLYLTQKPGLSYLYDELAVKNDKQKTIVILPFFTATAYAKGGFYDYFRDTCETCTTTDLLWDVSAFQWTSSISGIQALKALGYKFVSDMDVDRHPDILKNYDKVIVLHNEYVTKAQFDAITSHPKVMFLYPNALYAEITVDYDRNSITLIRGHQYPPDDSVRNGFDWDWENTHPFEYDHDCIDWKLYEIDFPNGVMLNCYPENKIAADKNLLRAIKVY